jgi:hypothetical protein
MTNYMAIDQHGFTYHHLGKFPRQALRQQLSGRVSKMYVDKTDGRTVQVGYVIGRNWLTLYEVKRVEWAA